MYRCKKALVSIVAALLILMTASAGIYAAEMWHYWLSGGEKEALDAFLNVARELYPDTEFTERGIPGSSAEMRRQMGAAFMANDPPEAYQSAIGYDMLSYVESDRLEPMDDIWEAINGEEVFSEGLKNLVTFNGHVYGIPLNTHVISHIFYNKAIFKKYNLTPPTTWEEYSEVSKTLRENGIEPFASAAGWTTPQFYGPLVSVLGPEGFLALGNGELAFTDPKVREAFELYGDAFVSSYMFGWAGYGWAEAADEVINGNAAMYLNGDWVVAYFEQAGWVPGEDFGFFPTPGTEDVIITQVDAVAAPKGAKDAKGAKNLLMVAGGVEGQRAFNRIKGSVAANLNVEPDIYNAILLETYERFQRINEEGTVLPNLLFMLPPSIYQELTKQVETYALNPTTKTLDTVLNTLESMRQELLKEGAFVQWTKM